jgi:hypothetical protein
LQFEGGAFSLLARLFSLHEHPGMHACFMAIDLSQALIEQINRRDPVPKNGFRHGMDGPKH